MARTEARIFTSIWRDKDFLNLPVSSQRLFLFLLSQDDLAMCGVIPLRESRWAPSAAGLTQEAIVTDLAVLESTGFVITDRQAGELLVRSLMRRDEVWKQWNQLESARRSAATVASARIRAEIATELERISREYPVSGRAEKVLAAFREEFLQVSEPNDFLPDRSNFHPNHEAIAEHSQSAGEGGRGRGVEVQTVGGDIDTSPDGEVLSDLASQDHDHRLDRPGDREDVERICQHLADRVEEQTGVRPAVGVAWRRAARLMLDKDHRTEQQVHAAIDWCQDDEFWRVNILSIGKLRTQYIRLRAAATSRRGMNGKSSTTNERVQQGLDLAIFYAQQEEKERKAIGA